MGVEMNNKSRQAPLVDVLSTNPTCAQSNVQLSNGEIRAFVELALQCDRVQCLDTFRDWCRKEVRAFLSFGMLIVASGRLAHGLLFVDMLLGGDYPDEFMQKILRRVALDERKVIQTWLACRQPQIVTPDNADEKLSELERFEFEAFDLRNFAAHGVIDSAGTQATGGFNLEVQHDATTA
jgi:hypothetical protein